MFFPRLFNGLRTSFGPLAPASFTLPWRAKKAPLNQSPRSNVSFLENSSAERPDMTDPSPFRMLRYAEARGLLRLDEHIQPLRDDLAQYWVAHCPADYTSSK